MIEIFGKDILDDRNLLHQFDQLTGASYTKPFECVGTVEEVNAALCYLIRNNHGNLPFLLEYYSKNQSSLFSSNNDFSTLLKDFNNEHFLTKHFEGILKKNLYD